MTVRPYNHADDYDAVGRFLVDSYRPTDILENWLQPRWEYMHFHSMSVGLPFDRCGVSEDESGISGVIHFESNPAFNYLQYRPGELDVAADLLDWADEHLGGPSESFDGDILGVYVNDLDVELERVIERRGFRPQDRFVEDHALFVIDGPIPDPGVPAGFELISLADENDLRLINRVLWRGFNHEGPPPDDEIPGRELAQQPPGFRKDLTIVVRAPNGDYATFAGMWVVPENRVAYVEPVATDPSYRRLGLGRAAVLESIRRAAAEGTEIVWVGSGQQFYLDMGFAVNCRSKLWIKDLADRRAQGVIPA